MLVSPDRFGPDALSGHDLLRDVERQTAAESVAYRIREMIHVGELSTGDLLPSERELADRMGLARLTLRAGLQLLRNEGYISAQRGRSGGNTVMDLRRPFATWAARVAEDPEAFADLTELRIAAETHAVRLAASRIGVADLAAMDEANRRLDGALSLHDFRSSDALFHQGIGRASGSPRLAGAIRSARGEMFVLANLELATTDVVASTRREHAEILELIAAGDGDGAAAAVERHIRATMTHLIDAIERGRDLAGS